MTTRQQDQANCLEANLAQMADRSAELSEQQKVSTVFLIDVKDRQAKFDQNFAVYKEVTALNFAELGHNLRSI